MEFRYREMICRPGYYDFHTKDRTEWLPVGIFNYNVSRMISDLEQFEKDPDMFPAFKASVLKQDVTVDEAIKHNSGLGELEEIHIEQADLGRPLIYVEVSPDNYSLIDGHHRLAKAEKKGIETLPAYFIPAYEAALYLGSENEYLVYVNYWNRKVEDYDTDPNYKGLFCPEPSLGYERDMDEKRIWVRILSELAACRRVEIYSEDSWFSLFYLNDKVYCGEAESQSTSFRCASPFVLTEEKLGKAAQCFDEWQYSERWDKSDRKERRKKIRKQMRHADMIMACVRVFSEY